MPLSPSLMATIPDQLNQFYSSYTFPAATDLTELPTPGVAEINGNTSQLMDNTILWGQDNNYFIPNLHDHDGALLDHFVSQDWDTMSSAWMPCISSDRKMGFYDNDSSIAGFQKYFSCGYQPHNIGEFDQEDIKPPMTAATENWQEIIHGNQVASGEEYSNNIKVERYSEEERKERIVRYLKKRNQRNFNKTIKYACRKTLADRRVRIRGRFARNDELSKEDIKARKKLENNHKEDIYGHDSIQQFQLKIKDDDDDDDWVHEATASLVYLSHSSPDDICIYSFANNK